MARVLAPSPPPRQPRYGLVASVGGEAAIRQFMGSNTPDGGPNRWEAGFEFQPEDCSSDTDPFDPTCGQVANFDAVALPDFVQFDPYAIWDGVKCSTFGSDSAELARRARAKLLTSTSHKVERELWTGAWSTAAGKTNHALASADAEQVDAGTATPYLRALADLQQALGECAQGSRGMIHATTRTASIWFAADAIRREGPLLLDPFDNIIVAGSGYTGSSPAGAVDATGDTAWAYATTMVDVRLSDVIASDHVDATNNTRMAIAYRLAAATWDDCCHLGVNVSHAAGL